MSAFFINFCYFAVFDLIKSHILYQKNKFKLLKGKKIVGYTVFVIPVFCGCIVPITTSYIRRWSKMESVRSEIVMSELDEKKEYPRN